MVFDLDPKYTGFYTFRCGHKQYICAWYEYEYGRQYHLLIKCSSLYFFFRLFSNVVRRLYHSNGFSMNFTIGRLLDVRAYFWPYLKYLVVCVIRSKCTARLHTTDAERMRRISCDARCSHEFIPHYSEGVCAHSFHARILYRIDR